MLPAPRLLLPAAALTAAGGLLLLVPTDIQQPGTQPLEVTNVGDAAQCDNCHGGYDLAVEPAHGWKGSTMALAGRDPLFWATVAVAEADFPGAGDLCIRCHSPRGWTEGRSTPTDGSALTEADAHGVECGFCHRLTAPDGAEHTGVQNPPFLARAPTSPPVGFHGSGMYVLSGNNEYHGPYADAVARHATVRSNFLRSSAACGTCHDVSNPVTGDLAPGNGAMLPLPPGTFSGRPGAPVTQKAAFLVEPHRYGAVERTFGEHAASSFASLRVQDYPNLPRDLRDGSIEAAHRAATRALPSGDYEDGTPRTFSCQTCHMPATVGKGANKRDVRVRPDLPLHDMTGGNRWIHDAILWLAQRGRLPIGNALDATQLAAIASAQARVDETLGRAAALQPVGGQVRVVNLTGHKLLTGFPEGRRLWLNVRWRAADGTLVREDGAYGPLQVQLDGRALGVESILDLHDPNLRIYHAEPGISADWAQALVGTGLPASLPIDYDRRTGAVGLTLGDVAALPSGSAVPSLHFVLNDRVVHDTRIPPYGFSYDQALARSALPVPAGQYGAPGPGGVYEHWDEAPLAPPAGAAQAEIRLLYQPTSWEYVQFLYLANDGSSAHLASTGRDLLDAWLATGMAAPQVVATSSWCSERGTDEGLELWTEVDEQGDRYGCRKEAGAGSRLTLGFESRGGALVGSLSALVIQLFPTGSPPRPAIPGLWFDRTDLQLAVPGLPVGGVEFGLSLPAGLGGHTLRVQAIALSLGAANGLYASSDAHDLVLR
jgi:hypothetical protein